MRSPPPAFSFSLFCGHPSSTLLTFFLFDSFPIPRYVYYMYNQRLQRLRSWSQDALHRSYVVDPATGSSVDSTQPATLTTDEGGGDGGGVVESRQYKTDPDSSEMMIGSTSTTQQQQKQQHRQNTVKSSKKMMFSSSSSYAYSSGTNIIPEPYLDEGEMKPLVYGYLYKLGRNGHWQRRFFETNGERLTYYKNVKRTTVLATLDLCKVRISREESVVLLCVICHSHIIISYLLGFFASLSGVHLFLDVSHRWERSLLTKLILTGAPLPFR